MNAARCFSGTHATREIHQRNSRDKRLPCEACFDLGDAEVEKDIVTFNEEDDEDVLVEEGPQIERARCFTGTHAAVRFTRGTFVASDSRVKRVLIWGDVKVDERQCHHQ